MAPMISTSKKPLFLPLVAFLTTSLLLLHKVNSQPPVRFNYPQFNSNHRRDFIFQGDAGIVSNNGGPLRLTWQHTNTVGRVLHVLPVDLSRLASFTTSFTFRIRRDQTLYRNSPGDGLAFFIAAPNSVIPSRSSGGLLGLFRNANVAASNSDNSTTFLNQADTRVVAVEFDTFVNSDLGDPNFRHVGIDVNSIRSRVTRRWEWVNNDPCDVTITYDGNARRLRVIANNTSGGGRVDLSFGINLRNSLPNIVRVGLSGATGGHSQSNQITRWSFFSTLLQSGGVAEEEKGEGYIASVV